ncbi:hypothetical protein [Methylobacterium trifolii]|uniref:FCP1 homology domain-containing protein n=1 Tax=Methylobacterium trifolii TaxID=1003092 RepID=A0ABQ4U4I9_9HYPH|nr:hypothetical protein [Methylobacterium trifolii]GJE62383.1 hypothetical protein MPOCJGCO_4516 [Methylobacterium trifolii]
MSFKSIDAAQSSFFQEVNTGKFPVTSTQVTAAVRSLLERDPESDHEIQVYMFTCGNMEQVLNRIMGSDEFLCKLKQKVLTEYSSEKEKTGRFDEIIAQHRDVFLCPSDLSVTEPNKSKVLLLGQCFFNDWRGAEGAKRLPVVSQQYIVGNLDDIPDSIMPSAYHFDFQIVAVPMAAAIPDSYLKISPNQIQEFEREFEASKQRIAVFIDAMLRFNIKYGLETYVCNFISPCAGLNGRFEDRYSLSNIIFFTEELNRFVGGYIKKFKNTYLLDLEAICSVHGKRYSRDDFHSLSNHGGTLTEGDAPLDANRLVRPPPATVMYKYDALPFVHGAWQEVLAMHRTLRATDIVKMVVIDLDDTLWRGLVGEGEGNIAGWPSSFAEALIHLKKRGIILAIIK